MPDNQNQIYSFVVFIVVTVIVIAVAIIAVVNPYLGITATFS